MPPARTKTSITNDVCWYVMNSVFLRYGPFALFVYAAFFEWKWHHRTAVIIASIIVMLVITFAHKYWGHIFGFYMLAVYQLDHIFILRMLKIVGYILLYFLVARPYKVVWLRVYLPVAHSWSGILTSKLYGYHTRGTIKEFTFLLAPPLGDLIIEEINLRDGKPFIHKYSHCMLFAGVILLGFTSLLLPRVVPPRRQKERTETRVLGASALDPAPAPAPAIDNPAPDVPPPPPPVVVVNAIQADPVAANLIAADETVFTTIAADETVVAAATAAVAAHDMVLIAASVAEAATALVAAAPDNHAASAAATGAVAASARADAAEVTAITVVGNAVAAAAAAAATEPGRWSICSMAGGWWETIGQNCKDLCTLREWLKWSNPGGLRVYEDFYRLLE